MAGTSPAMTRRSRSATVWIARPACPKLPVGSVRQPGLSESEIQDRPIHAAMLPPGFASLNPGYDYQESFFQRRT